MSSTHVATLSWQRETPGFAYREYNRNHLVRFSGGQAVQMSSTPEFLGDAALANPEEALAASLASCHMLTFLALASLKQFVVDRYTVEATAHLEKAADGKPWIAKVVLKPEVRFDAAKQPGADELKALHQRAHDDCFIARSVRSEVVIAL